MTTKTPPTASWNASATAACKCQLDAGLKMLEAMAEGARRIREAQLDAAVEAHACAEATRKQLEKAQDPQQLWQIQSAYLAGCMKDAAAYWSAIAQAALETQASIGQCLAEQAAAAPALDTGGAPLAEMMDGAYQRWLETTRQFYAAPLVARPQAREAG